LHAEGELVLSDARGDFRIAGLLKLQLVELGQAIEHAAARSRSMPGGRTGRARDRRCRQLDALMFVGKKPLPEPIEQALVGVSAAAVRNHDDEGGQVLRFGAQP